MELSQLQQILSTKLDVNTRFKLLDYFDTRSIETLDEVDVQANTFRAKDVALLLNDEVEYLVWDDLFDSQENLLQKAREEAFFLHENNMMKEAGFGKQL